MTSTNITWFFKGSVIGICGAGAMGAGIAQVAAQAGHNVIVYDSFDEALDVGKTRVAKGALALLKRGKISNEEAEAIQNRVKWTKNIKDIKPCKLIIEAIIERRDAKVDLFAQLEAIVSSSTILASNTSSLSISSLAMKLKRPENFLGLHFFNPAPIMKLVEVISGLGSRPDVVQSCYNLMEEWGKIAVMAKDVPGFIVNRIARPFYGEGWRAYEEEAASAATIDFLYRDLAGFRMGPLELGDLIGHDINSKAAKSIFNAYFGQTRFSPSLTQASFAESGFLGRKSGRGVYDYAEEAVKVGVDFAKVASLKMITCGPNTNFAKWFTSAEIDSKLPDGFVEVDGVLIGFSGGHTAGFLAYLYGMPVALLDVALDLNSVSALAYCVSDERADEAARAFITGLKKKAVRVKDRPGMIVLRTLLQIVNAAVDALRDQVADEAAIDKAMLYGVNYPVGPISWARGYGFDKVCAALEAIANETGQSRLYVANEKLKSLARFSKNT